MCHHLFCDVLSCRIKILAQVQQKDNLKHDMTGITKIIEIRLILNEAAELE